MVLPILSGIALNTFRFGKGNAHHLNAALLSAARQLSSAPPPDELKAALASKIPAQQERLKALKKAHGSKPLGEVTVDMCIGGMRGITVSARIC
jgi:citrate synthase